MNHAEIISSMPAAGWAAIFFIIAVIALFLVGVYRLILGKELKFGKFEVLTPQQRKAYESGTKDLLENQSENARNLLSRLWLDIFETGRRIFSITDRQELFLLEDIALLIDNKLQHAVHLDLLRNHLQEKTDEELAAYSAAKAEGYRNMIKAFLHQYDEHLPRYPLTEILNYIPDEDFKKIFLDIYATSRSIAGKGRQ